MKKSIIISVIILFLCQCAYSQSKIVKAFQPACDSLATLIGERTGVEGKLKLKAVMKRGTTLDFYFTESLGDFPWYKNDIKWLKRQLKGLCPEDYSKYRIGEIYSRKVSADKLVMPKITFDGKPSESSHRIKRPQHAAAIARNLEDTGFGKGLSGRHIAIWQSHGRYYDQNAEMWSWQRPCLFQTCEDMFTQGFVLPYLVPMLENAGAYVLLPRERDTQRNEVISDNDPTSGGRGAASYKEEGRWNDAGTGFADSKEIYTGLDNPFTMGTARMASCTGPSDKPTASATWRPQIPERGRYAVYVSYKTLPSSTSSARYTVHHLGGTSVFAVNQKMGGGTWIYLGTFEFGEGNNGYVTLDNGTPKGYRMEVGAVVTADAVKFGGGMGNIARNRYVSPDDTTSFTVEPTVSGLPRYAEAARYWLQWAGADSTIFHQNEGRNDYKDDFMSRGDWSEWISRGSRVNPSAKSGLGIPVDLTFGFHTDAGVTPDDSLVGTLAIYTYRSEGKTELPAGENRLTGRMFADMVQSQIVHDLQASRDSLWTRRSIWDRGYRESRTPASPSMLLELLSHQNFADMKYGLDPSFRFDVSRAVYKGMLKYLSSRYGTEYAVQPLPVSHVGVTFESKSKVVVSWKAVSDPLEPTAEPTGYIVYRRIGDGAFDKGTHITDLEVDSGGHVCFRTDIPAGEVVSFKIAAYNDGGLSFPSETVSIGIPADCSCENPVMIVNNFDRISAPAFFDGESRAGFDCSSDSGVPHMNDITFVGDMYNFRRDETWESNDRPGFGASYSDMAGEIVTGNTFDYPSVHGKAVLASGHPFFSCSNERLESDNFILKEAWAIDLICGKQVTTISGMKQDFTVFTPAIRKAISDFTADGGNVLVSGAYIGTDIWDAIYPVRKDSLERAEAAAFAKEVLGYKFVTNRASRRGVVAPVAFPAAKGYTRASFATERNPRIYCVESPDGIAPDGKSSRTIYRYTDSNISAGVAYEGKGYRCVSLGFPIETLDDQKQINDIIKTTLDYFKK